MLDGIAQGWTRLPDPPDVRPGASYVWTGSEVLAWDGCDPSVHDDCVAMRDGYAFDPGTERWSSIPPAPTGGEYARAVWTGEEAVFLSLAFDEHVGGVSYDPATGTWRIIADAPIEPPFGVVTVWTGSRILVWGGGERSDPATDGALYDPVTDEWTPIAPSPLGLNQASGLWTGREVIVFGSLLDNRNHAETDTSVGAAYDPATDTWRTLPPSELSPQAVSAVWAAGRMVAWDYETHSQEYDPATDRWSPRIKMPLDSSECYPDSVALENVVFGLFCGRAVLYDTASGMWQEIHGGMLDEEIWSDAYEASVKLWRFADLVPADDVVFLSAQGITLNDKGVACYGCEGSPTSFWAYRPPAT
jgi:N-acetylneuraminic acid mutarotase